MTSPTLDGEAAPIPRGRVDALTDGIYAFAMTLLVIDLRLPETFHPTTAHELLSGLEDLRLQFIVYLVSFWVLGFNWLGQLKSGERREQLTHGHGVWVLLRLFFVTCVPFSTMLVGRYGAFAPVFWLYAANLGLGAAVGIRLRFLDAQDRNAKRFDPWAPQMAVIVAAVLSVAVSLAWPHGALFPYVLTALPPRVRRRRRNAPP